MVPYAGLRFLVWNNFKRFFTGHVKLLRKSHRATGSDVAMLPRGGTIKCFAAILNADKSLEANLENKHGGPCRGRLFGLKLSLILGIMNSTDRREEKRNFLIQGRRFRRSFKNYCNYRYFMKLSRLLSIVKLGIDVLLSEHLQ